MSPLPHAVQKAAKTLLALHRLPVPVRIKKNVDATYFKRSGPPGPARKEHIQFGGRMIEHHLRDSFWVRSLSEMSRFGMLTLRHTAPAYTLATLIIHEISHALHARRKPEGKLGHGRVYLGIFKKELEERLESTATLIAELVEDPRLMEPRPALLSVARESRGQVSAERKKDLRGGFRAGQWVSFTVPGGEKLVGKLGRFNRKRWSFVESVDPKAGRPPRRYLVPASMLSAHLS